MAYVIQTGRATCTAVQVAEVLACRSETAIKSKLTAGIFLKAMGAQKFQEAIESTSCISSNDNKMRYIRF